MQLDLDAVNGALTILFLRGVNISKKNPFMKEQKNRIIDYYNELPPPSQILSCFEKIICPKCKSLYNTNETSILFFLLYS